MLEFVRKKSILDKINRENKHGHKNWTRGPDPKSIRKSGTRIQLDAE